MKAREHATERDFEAAVIELTRLFGWRVAHFRAGRTAHGWRTPVSADGAGFPDLVLVRPPRLFAELKSERGRLKEEQRAWLDALSECSGIEVYLWRPSAWSEIEETFVARQGAARGDRKEREKSLTTIQRKLDMQPIRNRDDETKGETRMQTLQEERRRLALEASQGDADAAQRLAEVEAELRATEIKAERAKLAEEEATRREAQEREAREEAARRKARTELRSAAAARETAAEMIEDAIVDLVAAIDDFADAGGTIHSLLKPAGVPKRPVGLGGDPIFDTRGAAIWIITRLYGSNLPKPLPRGPGGTGGSFAESVRSSHRETLPLDDDEESQR